MEGKMTALACLLGNWEKRTISWLCWSGAIVGLALNWFAQPLAAEPFPLGLPTDNTELFSQDPSQYFMYTDRNFEGVTSKPWQGGMYGFTRDQKRTSIGVLFTRLHEGMDVRPLHRDSSGNPLDEVKAISPGTVVYVNENKSHSNYGHYIVVHHDWGEGPFFSLYAHLNQAFVKPGDRVTAGQKIAQMGYTGAGINRERAHVHVELNFLLSDRFQKWYDLHFTTPNYHGIFNGFNLTGMNLPQLLIEHRSNPSLSIAQFLAKTEEPYFKVLVPNKGDLEFLRRYPWLMKDGKLKAASANSWEFTFARSGVPLAVEPNSQKVKYPAVSWVKPMNTNHSYLTMGRISGTGNSASLTASGSRYIQLISGDF